MAKYIAKRVGLMLLILFGVTVLVFFISHLVPSDPVAANLSSAAMQNEEIVNAYRAKWGLDKPLPVQYLLYLKNLLKGDLGTSIRTGNPVAKDLALYFPATAELAVCSILIAAVLGVLLGVLSAIFRNKPADYLVRTISVAGVSVPNFWFAIMMLFIFYYKLHIAPQPGRLSARMSHPQGGTGFYLLDGLLSGNMELFTSALSHLILPALVLGFFTMGLIARQMRSNLLEALSMDYVRTAKAKGMSAARVVMGHAFGNALIPVITVIGMGFCNLLGGTVMIEQIFSWPGIGQYAYQSAVNLDFPAICGVAILTACVYVVMNLLIDLLYGIIDPRIRYQ